MLCLLRQYGFVMGEARGEANKHDCNLPLPASLPASLPATLRAAEPFAEPDPEAEPEAEPADAPEPATEAQVAAAVAAALARDGVARQAVVLRTDSRHRDAEACALGDLALADHV